MIRDEIQRVSVGRAPHCFLDWCHGRKGGSVIRTSVVAVLEVQSIPIGGPQLWRVAMTERSGDPPTTLGHSCGPVQDEG